MNFGVIWQYKMVSEHRDEQDLFGDAMSRYDETVRSRACEYWQRMASLGTVDRAQKITRTVYSPSELSICVAVHKAHDAVVILGVLVAYTSALRSRSRCSSIFFTFEAPSLRGWRKPGMPQEKDRHDGRPIIYKCGETKGGKPCNAFQSVFAKPRAEKRVFMPRRENEDENQR